jgi:hypothetical protein
MVVEKEEHLLVELVQLVGKPALGMKTRKKKKLSDAYILRRSS